MLDSIVLLKGKDKLELNDAIFRKMCTTSAGPFRFASVSQSCETSKKKISEAGDVRGRVRAALPGGRFDGFGGREQVVAPPHDPNPVRTRLWVARHLIRIHKTQHVGVLLRDETMRRVFECYRLASLDVRLLLRRLQHRILMYLYRPGGTLAQREAQKLMNESIFFSGSNRLAGSCIVSGAQGSKPEGPGVGR